MEHPRFGAAQVHAHAEVGAVLEVRISEQQLTCQGRREPLALFEVFKVDDDPLDRQIVADMEVVANFGF